MLKHPHWMKITISSNAYCLLAMPYTHEFDICILKDTVSCGKHPFILLDGSLE